MLVIDGTILLALAVEAPQSGFARERMRQGAPTGAPQAALTEALEAARRLMREGHLARADFQQLPELWMPLLSVLAADAPLLPRAARFAAAYDLPMAAALALALAEVKGAALATLDVQLAHAGLDALGVERVAHPGEPRAAGAG